MTVIANHKYQCTGFKAMIKNIYIYGEAAREKSPAGLSIFATKSGKINKSINDDAWKRHRAHLSAAEPKLQ